MIILNPHAYSTGVLNDWNVIESGKKHEPPEPPAYIKGVVNNRNIIESGIKHEPPQSSGLQQRCGKWLKHYWKWGGFRRIMCLATFNNVSVIYHTCAVDWEV
jgi:hypothetical protein